MNGLLATLIEEELLAREARALGLDQNDTIVRRRLAQKLTFIVEDTSRIADPSEDELRRFHSEHAERYRTDPRITFRHIFFSPAAPPACRGGRDRGADSGVGHRRPRRGRSDAARRQL